MLEDRTHDTAEPVADPECPVINPGRRRTRHTQLPDQDSRAALQADRNAADTKDASCKLDEQHFDVVILDNTGLFSGAGARPLDAGFAAHAWDSDQRIQQLSGQPFSEAYLDNVLNVPGTLLDSGAATLGISAAGFKDPRRRLPALKAIQHARYVDGRDIMTTGGVAEVLEDAGMVDAARLVSAPSEDFLVAHRDLVGRGRTLFQQLHANGTPALALIRNGMPRLIGSNALYGSYNNLLAQIQAA